MTALTSRPRRLLLAAIVACLSSTLLAVSVIWWIGHQATLNVSASTGVPDCDGAEPVSVRDDGTKFERAAIPLRRGFSCTVTIRVVNRGDRVVSLREVSVPVGGPRGGGSFQVTRIGGIQVPEDDAIHAVGTLDVALESGAEHLVDLQVDFRPGGCLESRGTIGVDPEVLLDSLVASRALIVADLPLFLGTADSSCNA